MRSNSYKIRLRLALVLNDLNEISILVGADHHNRKLIEQKMKRLNETIDQIDQISMRVV